MDDQLTALGIDAGGTHTDAVICERGRILGRAKVVTRHDDLPESIREVLAAVTEDAGKEAVARVGRVTLGTTLLVNSQVQGKLDPVGMALSAGPGLSPLRSAVGEYTEVVPGGLDHRGVEVSKLDVECLRKRAQDWYGQGIRAFASVGKFSPRNPAHEKAMAGVLGGLGKDVSVTLGHQLGGELNFPRRIVTAYYNAASSRLHKRFLDAVSAVLNDAHVAAPVYLLKADGGAMPMEVSRTQPVQSILSGPAASVMGIMALARDLEQGCALLMDIGGTTTDLALFVDGSPVTDRNGMLLGGRRTLVRALATLSIGVGGDSLITVSGEGGGAKVVTGPERTGMAMAFGGSAPTLLDALNMLNAGGPDEQAGNVTASADGMAALAARHGLTPEACARAAWDSASKKIETAIRTLMDSINGRPIYTLRELKGHRDVAPDRIYLVGGPAACLARRVEKDMKLPVATMPEADVANAVGAAQTRPTAQLQVYADTGRWQLLAPALDICEKLPAVSTLESVRERACALLKQELEAQGDGSLPIEVTESELFATLSDSGRGTKDIRVVCQAIPGIFTAINR